MTLERDDLTHHFSRQFNQEMEDLRTRVLAMGGLVEQQTADAITALISGDINLASTVVQRDVQVNAMEVAVDEDCSRILAEGWKPERMVDEGIGELLRAHAIMPS